MTNRAVSVGTHLSPHNMLARFLCHQHYLTPVLHNLLLVFFDYFSLVRYPFRPWNSRTCIEDWHIKFLLPCLSPFGFYPRVHWENRVGVLGLVRHFCFVLGEGKGTELVLYLDE